MTADTRATALSVFIFVMIFSFCSKETISSEGGSAVANEKPNPGHTAHPGRPNPWSTRPAVPPSMPSACCAADRRWFRGGRGWRHNQMSRWLRRSHDHAGPRHNRRRDHAIPVAQRIVSEVGPQAKCADRRDNAGDDHGDQLSALVTGGHCLVLHSISWHFIRFQGTSLPELISKRLTIIIPALPCLPPFRHLRPVTTGNNSGRVRRRYCSCYRVTLSSNGRVWD